MKKKIVWLVFLAATAAGPTWAIFGLGDIVFDPTNFGEAVQQVVQLEQQYAQLVQTYQMIKSQYNQMVWMAQQVPVNMALRYGAPATLWTPSSAGNTYGTTGGWVSGINTGQGVANGYAGAILTLNSYGGAFGRIPADQVDRVKTSYATVELTDGSNLAAMQTLGQIRANAPAVEMAIRNLENDSLSADPDMNTEIAVLNKVNAADVISVRNSQDTNKLLAALAEGQIIQAKRQRDAEAQAFNDHIRFITDAQAVMAAQAAGASSAMMAWRMP